MAHGLRHRLGSVREALSPSVSARLLSVSGVRWRGEKRLQCCESRTRARPFKVSTTTRSPPVIKIIP